MDQQTLNFVAAMALLIACGVVGQVIGAAISRKQFSIRGLMVLMTAVGVATAIMVARSRW